MIIPSRVNAVNLIPTGIDSNADKSAMCSFPLPEAIETATSISSNFPESFVSSSFFRSISGLFWSYSTNSKGTSFTLNSFANGAPRTIIFCHSPFLMSPAT